MPSVDLTMAICACRMLFNFLVPCTFLSVPLPNPVPTQSAWSLALWHSVALLLVDWRASQDLKKGYQQWIQDVRIKWFMPSLIQVINYRWVDVWPTVLQLCSSLQYLNKYLHSFEDSKSFNIRLNILFSGGVLGDTCSDMARNSQGQILLCIDTKLVVFHWFIITPM